MDALCLEVSNVPIPDSDPVFGTNGPLFQIWKSARSKTRVKIWTCRKVISHQFDFENGTHRQEQDAYCFVSAPVLSRMKWIDIVRKVVERSSAGYRCVTVRLKCNVFQSCAGCLNQHTSRWTRTRIDRQLIICNIRRSVEERWYAVHSGIRLLVKSTLWVWLRRCQCVVEQSP